MRTDPSRLDIDRYPFAADIPPRFTDMDALRHLNNVALASIYEEGRLALHRAMHLEGRREKGTRTVVAQVNISYLPEGHYPQPIKVAGRIGRIGGASYVIEQGLFQEGRCIGVCDTVIVNTSEGRSHPLAPAFREALKAFQIEEPNDG